eukprot:20925-Heterococcus_DN1.PRE.2
MAEKGWIEGREGATKTGGAFCTTFAKSRNPRVYLSAYTGSAYWISTLAHELGHVRAQQLSTTLYSVQKCIHYVEAISACKGSARSALTHVHTAATAQQICFVIYIYQAYHSWVMKDLSLSESSYPMNLAETASIFFEVIH